MARKNPDPKSEPPILEAAAKAELLIRGLQNRLAERADYGRARETPEDLAWELEKYFAAETKGHVASAESSLERIRRRVVEGVSEKILNGWESSAAGTAQTLENQVVERLVKRVFQWLTETPGEVPSRTLSETVSQTASETADAPNPPALAARYR